uniref:Uncharacterized protein n=1 Tax=Oncorhynchus tshawytscha TaxID=74940 RepID=A0A8C8IV87_ONCTS
KSCNYYSQANQKDILLHVTTKRTAMLQQLHEGLEVYILIEVLQKNPKECLNLFVDAHYIISNLAPEMSESGSPKQKETEILDFFKDFLQELDGMYFLHVCTHPYLADRAATHTCLSQREKLKMVIIFDHSCLERMPNYTVCYPVSAYTKTITFPTAHLRDYDAFKSNIETAIKYSARFDRV